MRFTKNNISDFLIIIFEFIKSPFCDLISNIFLSYVFVLMMVGRVGGGCGRGPGRGNHVAMQIVIRPLMSTSSEEKEKEKNKLFKKIFENSF